MPPCFPPLARDDRPTGLDPGPVYHTSFRPRTFVRSTLAVPSAPRSMAAPAHIGTGSIPAVRASARNSSLASVCASSADATLLREAVARCSDETDQLHGSVAWKAAVSASLLPCHRCRSEAGLDRGAADAPPP